MPTILIADDDEHIAELIELYLEKDGIAVERAADGVAAWERIQRGGIDLAILDIMMPGMDGYALVRRIRERYPLPVIMLSAKGEDRDKILGLELGADDYMTKPFNPLEIVARVQAQLRRCTRLNPEAQAQRERALRVGTLTLDENTCEVRRDGELLALTQTEYRILDYLMRNPNRVLTKKQIFESVWGEPWVADDGTVMVHISNLRDKLEPDSRQPQYLKTIRGLGYKLEG